jgi:hypothetical protein
MTERKRRRSVARPAGDAEVVSITAGAVSRLGYKRFASARVAGARRKLGMTLTEFADYLAGEVGYPVTPETVMYWEEEDSPPSEVYLAAEAALGGAPRPEPALLDSVPNALPASAIAGAWVTAYQFTHAGTARFHADIAHVTAVGERDVQAVNHPPPPRTQGRASPFRNEIEGRLFSRHLKGDWRNTSDTRYFGGLQLAVLPGETVMDGHYGGYESDISVSVARWKWVRLEPGDLSALTLREPSALYELVMSRTQDDPPLTVDDIREEA